ncbi:helix-turn-helix domain-containing protein [Cribrihabitans neustonicus]|uniref:helix-turn-helix domain-containing protein n=1 Tax=Cribrihabitans neustonicus TaxID=1429085 RepID=UPI003B5BDCD5
MIGRLTQRRQKGDGDLPEPKGFDDFELRLGDVMRGERATMGKSLLDVQRELRIKASYVAAIENCDPSAFDTPGFIAGYVRSYARYLGMDPEQAFAAFCRESGFSVAHGMSAEASGRKQGPARAAGGRGLGGEAFTAPNTPFVPVPSGLFSQVEPRAVGSLMVLAALIGGIGYGGWAVLKEVQQVQFAPVEQTPAVLADLDPLAGAAPGAEGADAQDPAAEALDRLYRPQALEVPVLAARDAPIATIDPASLGNFVAPAAPSVLLAEASLPHEAGPETAAEQGPPMPQVVADVAPSIEMVAVRPSWVQVTAVDGSVIYETIMDAGQRFTIPLSEGAPKLRTGESSAIYFAVNGEHFGPVGKRGAVTKNIELSQEAITERFQLADLTDSRNEALATLVAQLQTEAPSE